jgi:hypothetical protein
VSECGVAPEEAETVRAMFRLYLQCGSQAASLPQNAGQSCCSSTPTRPRRIAPFHGGNTGSIPVGRASEINDLETRPRRQNRLDQIWTGNRKVSSRFLALDPTYKSMRESTLPIASNRHSARDPKPRLAGKLVACLQKLASKIFIAVDDCP